MSDAETLFIKQIIQVQTLFFLKTGEMIVDSFLMQLLKAGGVTAFTIGVVYLLYRRILKLNIFSTLGKTQTLVFLSFFAFLIWLIVMYTLFLS